MTIRPSALFFGATAWSFVVGLAVFFTTAIDDDDSAQIAAWLIAPMLLGLLAALVATRLWAVWPLTVAFVVATLLALPSFGMFLLPAAVAMVIGAVRATRQRTGAAKT